MALIMENLVVSALAPNATPTDDVRIQDEDSTTTTLSDRVGPPNRLYSYWRDADGNAAVGATEDDVFSQTSDAAENTNRIPLTESQVSTLQRNLAVLGFTHQD